MVGSCCMDKRGSIKAFLNWTGQKSSERRDIFSKVKKYCFSYLYMFFTSLINEITLKKWFTDSSGPLIGEIDREWRIRTISLQVETARL